MQIRYGIAEWYGRRIDMLTADERSQFAEVALRVTDGELPVAVPLCPFMQPLQPGGRCNKSGGVCSIRQYVSDKGNVSVTTNQPVTVCPNRFRERSADHMDMFSVIGAMLFDDSHPIVVKEVPFLRRRRDVVDGGSKVGRIDWVVLPRDAVNEVDPRWAAVETQSMYFSGINMGLDIADIRQNPGSVRFPRAVRRPDYRSSGPKRLSPQLDVKAPRIGRWGKNTVVVVDKFFWDQMPGLYESEKIDVDNAEVIWVVLKYDEELHLVFDRAVGATMQDSREALSGTEPMSKAEFNASLLRPIAEGNSTKVFRL